MEEYAVIIGIVCTIATVVLSIVSIIIAICSSRSTAKKANEQIEQIKELEITNLEVAIQKLILEYEECTIHTEQNVNKLAQYKREQRSFGPHKDRSEDEVKLNDEIQFYAQHTEFLGNTIKELQQKLDDLKKLK